MAPLPTDLDSFVPRSERYWFRGIILTSISYGIGFCLYLACASLLVSRAAESWSNPRSPGITRERRRWDIFSLVYITFMLACSTTNILAEGLTGEKAYVDFRDAPSGPAGYLFYSTFQHVTVLKAAYISFVLCNWGAIGLMMWRCLVIYKYSMGGLIASRRIPVWMPFMTIPFFLLLGSIGGGIIFLVQALSPSSLPESIQTLNWTVIWGSIAVSLEWILTGMITIRLLMLRQSIQKTVGDKYCLKYTSIATMLIESSGILSSFSVFYLVTFATKSPVMVMSTFLLPQLQVISPLLIIYRVSSGRAWTRRAVPSLGSPAVFREHDQIGLTISDSTLDPTGPAALQLHKLGDGHGSFYQGPEMELPGIGTVTANESCGLMSGEEPDVHKNVERDPMASKNSQ